MKRLRWFLLPALLVPMALSAQWGFRFSPLHYQTASGLGFFKQRHYTVGFDIDANERITYGLEFLFGNSPEMSSYKVNEGTYMGYRVEYFAEDRNMGLMYRCEYAFSDNDAFHGYLASTLGFVRVKRDLIINSVYQTTNNYYDMVDPSAIGLSYVNKATGMSIPVGLRLGARSGLEGFYVDMYVGAGINLGSKDLSNAPFMRKNEANMAGTFIQLGVAAGIGGG